MKSKSNLKISITTYSGIVDHKLLNASKKLETIGG